MRFSLRIWMAALLCACGGGDRADDAGRDAALAVCGTTTCPLGRVCCGPSECGFCIPEGTMIMCPTECPAPFDAGMSDAGMSDAGPGFACGAETCGAGQICCGPPSCGFCVPEGSGIACPAECPGDAGTPGACPGDPPASGSTCSTPGMRCTWLRCAAEGMVDATCTEGAWYVATSACSEHDCAGELCTSEQLCHEQAGGALIGTCEANPCGEGAIEASCACTLCGSYPCTVYGLTVQCNTCPGPVPCP